MAMSKGKKDMVIYLSKIENLEAQLNHMNTLHTEKQKSLKEHLEKLESDQSKKLDDVEKKIKVNEPKWSKGMQFLAGIFAIPVFIILGTWLDKLSEDPYITRLFHHWIGTTTAINSELDHNSSPLRKSILKLASSTTSIHPKVYMDAFDLGVVNDNQLAKCIQNSKATKEEGIIELSKLEIGKDDDIGSSQTYESINNCQSTKIASKNSLFNIKDEHVVDIKIGISVRELIFEDNISSKPLYANITHRFTSEKLLQTVKFSIGNGEYLKLSREKNPFNYQLPSVVQSKPKFLTYYFFTAHNITLPAAENFMNVLNTQLEPQLADNTKVSLLIQINPTGSTQRKEDTI